MASYDLFAFGEHRVPNPHRFVSRAADDDPTGWLLLGESRVDVTVTHSLAVTLECANTLARVGIPQLEQGILRGAQYVVEIR